MPSKKDSGAAWWIVQQHDQLEVVESREVPSNKVEPGERGKLVFGPYQDKAAAESMKNEMKGRTLRGKQEGR